MIFQTDRYGFNNPDYEWDSKYTDYMLVGDSFTKGPDNAAVTIIEWSDFQ